MKPPFANAPNSAVRMASALLALAVPVLASCNDGAPYRSAVYSDDAMWLCKPGIAVDHCTTAALGATRMLADATRADEPFTAPTDDPGVDCFYVYPTVDTSLIPANHEDFSDVAPMLVPLESQAARFSSLCRVYAPLYRQGTIGSYFTNGAAATPYEGVNGDIFNVAYADVLDAFRHYMAQDNHGRPIVLIGHSQGSMHLTRLIQEEFDAVPAMRAKLVSALLIGAGVEVPTGQVVGATFQNIPLCTSSGQTGCVIAYRSYAEALPPTNDSNGVPSPGRDVACTHPASLGAGRAALREAYFPMTSTGAFQIEANYPVPAVTTPFVAYPGFYEAQCQQDVNGRSFLAVRAIGAAGDPRTDPIIYNTFLLDPGFLGTHILDYNFAMGDLLDRVQEQIATLPP